MINSNQRYKYLENHIHSFYNKQNNPAYVESVDRIIILGFISSQKDYFACFVSGALPIRSMN